MVTLKDAVIRLEILSNKCSFQKDQQNQRKPDEQAQVDDFSKLHQTVLANIDEVDQIFQAANKKILSEPEKKKGARPVLNASSSKKGNTTPIPAQSDDPHVITKEEAILSYHRIFKLLKLAQDNVNNMEMMILRDAPKKQMMQTEIKQEDAQKIQKFQERRDLVASLRLSLAERQQKYERKRAGPNGQITDDPNIPHAEEPLSIPYDEFLPPPPAPPDDEFVDNMDLQLKALQAEEDEQDKTLDRMAEKLTILKDIAMQAGEKLAIQIDIIKQIDVKVDKTTAQIETLNQKMKKDIIKKLDGGKFMLYFILVCVVLAVVAFIIHQFF